MDINLNINAPDLVTAITDLAKSITEYTVTIDAAWRIRQHEANEIAETKIVAYPEKTTTIEKPAKATQAPAPETTTEEAPEATLEDVRAELARLNKSGKKDITKGLLTKYKADSLSSVNPKDYGALYAEAKAAR